MLKAISRKDSDMPKHPDMPQILEPPVTTFGSPVPIYDATFSDGSLKPALDVFGIGPLQCGYSELNNPYYPEPQLVDGELVLGVTLPAAATGVTLQDVTAGVFATRTPPPLTIARISLGEFERPLPFDTQAPFLLQGTYVAPSGPSDKVWAVGILARTGGVEDLTTNTQVIATLQFNSQSPRTARLNVPAGATSHQPVHLPPPQYDAVRPFRRENPVPPVPFTLGLFVDRISNTGAAYLTVEGYPTLSTNFLLKDFLPSSGPAITAVGTVIANRSANDETVTVRVQDFGIYATV